MKKLILLFLFSTLLFQAQQPILKKGNPFPDFQLQQLDGTSLTMESLKGKIVFINLWFTNCAPCVEEMPELNKMASAYQDRVVFLSLTFDSAEKVQNFLAKQPFHFTHLVSAGGFIKMQLQNNEYPKNIILDRDGTMVLINNGLPFQPDKETGEMKPASYKLFGRYLDQLLAL